VEPLKIGILGLHEGATLLKALGVTSAASVVPDPLERVPRARVLMACDLDPKKLEECRPLRPEVTYTRDYREMLENPDLEDGLYALCLMEATRRSARQGGVPLKLAPLLEEVGLAA
jgi:hypothetical protein